ncbi:MAG: hypothetical protein KKA28_09800 [Planctomycetes bacterium]|nr:hypothetical protein [Planctomycetota bacterium]
MVHFSIDLDIHRYLGNREVEGLSKAQFLSAVENTGIPKERTHYSFDRSGLHVVVLDANYRADGADYDTGNFQWTDANLPPTQLAWLEKDLAGTKLPAVLCVHQLLDRDEGSHYVRNAAEVRRVPARHPRVPAVFQGHQHRGQYNRVDWVHYYTLKAVVEGSGKTNNAYAIVELHGDTSMTITGYRQAVGGRLASSSS